MGLFGPSLNELAEKEYQLRKNQKEKQIEQRADITEVEFEKNDSNLISNKILKYLCILLIVLLVAFIPIVIWGESLKKGKGITLAEFNEIQNGMTYQEVVDIVGEEGILLSDVDLNIGSEYTSSIYMWYANNDIFNANVTFQGGKVIGKAQFGLK